MRRTHKGKAVFATGVRWTLTLAALALAAIVAATAYYMLVPVDFTGPGVLGVIALTFPLHLLLVTIAAAGFGALAWRRGARSGAALFGLAAALSAAMALWPSLALWRRAGELGVPLSLGDYFANALRPNLGGPDPARGVVYSTAPDGAKLQLDIWRAAGTAGERPHPAFVRVHGGGWLHGARGALGAWDRWLSDLGYDVFDVEYRLNPPERWRDQVGDVKCALGWVAAHAAEYRIDPARIGMMGFSAGSQLGMLAAYSPGDAELPPSCDAPSVPIKLVVNLYGPVDLVVGYSGGRSLIYARDVLRHYLGGPPAAYPERYRAASPINHVGTNTPPTITLLGASDRIVGIDQAQILDAGLTRAGVPHETYLLPATDHVFDINWGGFPAQIARAKIKQFLREYD